jgi:hypothetical protein
VLLVGRPAETDKRVLALASADGVDSVTVHGLPDCARPRDFLPPVPYAAVDSIVEWLDGNVSTRTYGAAPKYLTTVTMPAEGLDGADVVETIERIEPTGLFAIRTRPKRRGPAPAKTMLFFVLAKDLHVGPGRKWVELSRRLASTGSQAVRWDPAGLNFSGRVGREPYRFVYSKADIADSIAAARHARRDGGELDVVGICSGAWYAAIAARSLGARSAILVNPRPWNWRITSTLFGQWLIWKNAVGANVPAETRADTGESKMVKWLKAILNAPRDPVKSLIHDRLPRYMVRVLSWVGLVWMPEDMLATLAHRGTDVTLIASPEDAADFTFRNGWAALDRLQRTSRPPRVIATLAGDHSAHHPAILAAIDKAVFPGAAALPSPRIAVPEISSPPNLLAANRSNVPTGSDVGGVA